MNDKVKADLQDIFRDWLSEECYNSDKAIELIGEVFAKTVRSAVPEKIAEDEPHGSLDGMTEAEIFNDAIDTFTTNLKNQGLLPNGKESA